MTVRLRAAALASDDPASTAAFWARLLDRRTVHDDAGVLVPGDERQIGLRVVPGRAPRPGQGRMHVHLTSASEQDQQATVDTAVRLGARHLDVGQRPEEGHVVLADPAGNAFCVIEPGNAFLSGCGRLGELAGEGTRAVGLFWSAVLGWPLVWDQGGETAVQSPAGGTKVAFGGPPVRPVDVHDVQHLDLVVAAAELPAEVDRLVALGAGRCDTEGDTERGAVVLTDPDGTLLRIWPGPGAAAPA